MLRLKQGKLSTLAPTRNLDALPLTANRNAKPSSTPSKTIEGLDLAGRGKKPSKEPSLKIRPGQEWKLKIKGTAQKTKTPGHALESTKQAVREANGKRKIEKEQYKVSNIDFYGGGEPGTNHAWKLVAYYSEEDRTAYLCFDEEIIPFSYEVLEQLLIDLCQFCSPKYGIGFESERKYGPDDYATGYSQGLKLAYENPEHGKEDERIHCWRKKYHRKGSTYQTGDLRDVYPLNVLSHAHLNRLVNGHRFQDWVQASGERGQLKQISETVWTWWVKPERIPAVGEALAPSGMILCL